MGDPALQSGLFTSLRQLTGTALEMAQVRLDLLGTEIELEKRHVIVGLLWGALALTMFGVGLVLLCGFVVLLFWDAYRLAAVGVLALLFICGGLFLVRQAQRRLSSDKSIFEASVAELARDRTGLKSPSLHDQ